MSTTTYQVTGMTCGHCVQAVTSEVSAIDGVTDVQVDLESGRATVTSDQPLDAEAVAGAVDEAGYQLVP
jgi:copper ion binding protein